MLEAAPKWVPKGAVAEVMALWAVCFGGIIVTFVTFTGLAKLVATLGFLYLPQFATRQRGEDFREYGLTLRHWRADLKLFLVVGAIVFPLFIAGYVAFTWALPLLPPDLMRVVTPYVKMPHFAFRLPDRFGEWVIDQTFVVALPEEFFYRGYMQTRLRDAWPDGRILWGVRLGKAFWVTAILFALGHLAIFQVWRLAVFFPALLFGWMREKTGSVLAAALIHACSNLLVQVLDASFFG